MKRPPNSRRRPAVHITLGRAARLHRLVMLLAESPRARDQVLSQLGIGLRTFYRELELLTRCGVKVQHKEKSYTLLATAEEAEGRLPFPDPQLSFAEMAELSRCRRGQAAKGAPRRCCNPSSSFPTPSKGKKGRVGKGRPSPRERAKINTVELDVPFVERCCKLSPLVKGGVGGH